jgi:hypothetical protein
LLDILEDFLDIFETLFEYKKNILMFWNDFGNMFVIF